MSLLVAAVLLLGAPPFEATVSAVAAGDLIAVRNGSQEMTIRLYGVDCPDEGQPFAQQAIDFVKSATGGKTLKVTPVATDNLGVAVAKIEVPGTGMLHEKLVEQGLGWWDRENTKTESALRRLNAQAILGQMGLWADATQLAPWDYRKSHGGQEIKYQVEPPAEKPKPAPAPVPTLKAKGTKQGAVLVTPEMIRQAENLDPMALMMQHMPSFVRDSAGKAVGLTATNISQIPLAAALGFRDGDIIASVNGIKLEQESQLLGLGAQLQGQKNFVVEVIRGGQPTTIRVNLP